MIPKIETRLIRNALTVDRWINADGTHGVRLRDGNKHYLRNSISMIPDTELIRIWDEYHEQIDKV